MLVKASGKFNVNIVKNSGAVKNFTINLENLIKKNNEFNQAKVNWRDNLYYRNNPTSFWWC